MSRAFPAAVVALALLTATSPFAQNVAPDQPHPTLVAVKRVDPTYPQLAKTAHITGDVELTLRVRKDGKVDSVDDVTGPPLLQRAAEDSARQTQWECRDCREDVTSFRGVYQFRVAVDPKCRPTQPADAKSETPSQPAPRTEAADFAVNVTASTPCIEIRDGFPATKVRSAKCLWLWRCKTLKYE
jgi:hypothetical protein